MPDFRQTFPSICVFGVLSNEVFFGAMWKKLRFILSLFRKADLSIDI